MIKSQPSMYCEQHQPLGTREDCRPCNIARRAFDTAAKALALERIKPTYEALRAAGGIGAVAP